MTETPDVTAARELLAGGVPFPLSREVEDRLVTAHEALVAADATREPVIVTVWQSQRASHISSVTGAISTNAVFRGARVMLESCREVSSATRSGS